MKSELDQLDVDGASKLGWDNISPHVRNPDSGKFSHVESGIPLTIGILNPSSTEKDLESSN